MNEFVEYITPWGEFFLPKGPIDGSVCVTISGGADSALLAHLLLSHKIKPHTVIVLKTGAFLDSNIKTNPGVERVIGFLNLYHNVNLNVVEMERIGNSHNIEVDIKHLGTQFDYVFSGVTALPPEEANITGMHPLRPEKTGPSSRLKKFMLPFKNLDKRIVPFMMHRMNLLELYNLTWSCTTNATNKCQICFSCQERAWAENSSDII